MKTQDQVNKILSNHCAYLPSEITPELSIEDDLGLDLLDKLEMLMRVEEQFDICVPDVDSPKIKSVGDLCLYIDTKLAEVDSVGI